MSQSMPKGNRGSADGGAQDTISTSEVSRGRALRHGSEGVVSIWLRPYKGMLG